MQIKLPEESLDILQHSIDYTIDHGIRFVAGPGYWETGMGSTEGHDENGRRPYCAAATVRVAAGEPTSPLEVTPKKASTILALMALDEAAKRAGTASPWHDDGIPGRWAERRMAEVRTPADEDDPLEYLRLLKDALNHGRIDGTI